MEDDSIQAPVELQQGFSEALEVMAKQDDEGTLEIIPHEQLMRKMQKGLDSIESSMTAFEAKNPEYAPSNIPLLDRE